MTPSPPSPPNTLAAELLELGFHLVESHHFGALPRDELVVIPGFTAAVLPGPRRDHEMDPGSARGPTGSPPSLIATRIDETFGVEGVAESLVSLEAVTGYLGGPVQVLQDLRALRTDLTQEPTLLQRAVAVLPNVEAAAARMGAAQITLLTPADWRQHFWTGLLGHLPRPVTVTSDESAAWADAGASATERGQLERAFDLALRKIRSPRTRAAHTLAAQPSLSLRELARALHVSVRKLQRDLADEGTAFTELREVARIERAQHLLSRGEKVAAVGAALGFESTSHFITWHKRKTGLTPGRGRFPSNDKNHR